MPKPRRQNKLFDYELEAIGTKATATAPTMLISLTRLAFTAREGRRHSDYRMDKGFHGAEGILIAVLGTLRLFGLRALSLSYRRRLLTFYLLGHALRLDPCTQLTEILFPCR
jgi:hypothetical protein